MKRDWELIREILLCVEEQDRTHDPKCVYAARPNELLYHEKLLIEAELIEDLRETSNAFGALPVPGVPTARLTWQGHDFLDAIRDDAVWNRTKDQATKSGGAITLAVLTQLASHYLKEKLGMLE